MAVKSLARLTRPLRSILVASIVTSLLATAVDLYAYAQYAALPAGDLYADHSLESDALNAVAGLVQAGLALALAVIFLMWVYRANANCAPRPARRCGSPSVGWFFIPVANVFKPYQAVKEIWTVSHGAERLGHGLVQWWWGLFLLTNVLGQAAWRSAWDVVYVDDYRESTLTYAVSDGADAIGMAVTLLLVGAIATAFSARVDETGVAPIAGVPMRWSPCRRRSCPPSGSYRRRRGAPSRPPKPTGAATPPPRPPRPHLRRRGTPTRWVATSGAGGMACAGPRRSTMAACSRTTRSEPGAERRERRRRQAPPAARRSDSSACAHHASGLPLV
jgi:hypothetical protein